MKALLILLSFVSYLSFGQTNVIAAKSHAAKPLTDNHDIDNFGEYIPPRKIQSVKYLQNDCIVETYHSFFSLEGDEKEYDTICNHPFLGPGQMDIERLKAMYPSETEFVGFDELEQNQKKNKRELKKENRKQRKSSISLFILLLGGGLLFGYLFLPNFRSSRS